MEGLRPKEVRASCLAGNGAGGLLPPREDHPSFRRESTAGTAQARRRSGAALFQCYLRIHSPPLPLPPESGYTTFAETPPTSPRWVELHWGPTSLPPPLVVIGCVHRACPPTSKVDWSIEGSVGEKKQIIKSVPLPLVLMVKSRGASLGSCHYPLVKPS